MSEHTTPTFDKDKFIRCADLIYQALQLVGDEYPGVAASAVAAIRSIMINTLGFDEQRELMTLWNEKEIAKDPHIRGRYWIAIYGVEHALKDAGIDSKWIYEMGAFYQHFPPLKHLPTAENIQELISERDQLDAASEWKKACDMDHPIIAYAMWNAEESDIRTHAQKHLDMMQQASINDPNAFNDTDWEFYNWIVDNTPAITTSMREANEFISFHIALG